MDDKRVKHQITHKPAPFTAWLLRASPAELLEGGYLIAKTLDRTGLAALRDYTNARIDTIDRRGATE